MVAVLDWGLGHATRCVPLVEALIRSGAEPILASNGRAGLLLRQAFPQLTMEDLPPYGVRYGTANMYWNMMRQGPRLVSTVRKEYRHTQKLVDHYALDAIISDNRYGCFSSKVPSVFITHQVNLYFPRRVISRLMNRFHHHLIRNFDECWIPDIAASSGLAGSLSHPAPFPGVVYLGLLSRLRRVETTVKNELLVLLSGPEPQRTNLQDILRSQLQHREEKVIFVLGKPENSHRHLAGNIMIIDHLGADELSEVMSSCRQVVCRSGYSTLMDLATLRKKAILIPTPGQTEQEYLARRLTTAGICYHEQQSAFDIGRALERSKAFSGFPGGQFEDGGQLERVLNAFLNKL